MFVNIGQYAIVRKFSPLPSCTISVSVRNERPHIAHPGRRSHPGCGGGIPGGYGMTKKALLHGTVETMAGRVLRDACVVIDAGKIVSVEEKGTAPEGCEVFDVTGTTVTPGFIDAHTHIGTYCDGFPEAMEDANDMVDPVAPQLRILDAIYQDDTAFADALRGGVTCVQTLPGSGNIIGGQGAVIKTKPDVADRMVMVAPSGMKAALGENPIRVYKEKGKLPNTRMGNAALMRSALVNAANYRAKREQAETKGDAFERNLAWEAMLPVLDGTLPLRVHAHRCDDIATAVRIAKEFGVRLTIEHCTEGHLIADFLAENNVMAAVGPTLTGKPKIELRNKTWETLPILYKAGVHLCIITDHPVIPLEHLSVCVALAVKAGLPREAALRCVTLGAAEHLGIQDRVGTLEPGKDADIVVWDGDPLDARTSVRLTFVNGEVAYRA